MSVRKMEAVRRRKKREIERAMKMMISPVVLLVGSNKYKRKKRSKKRWK